MPRYTQAEIFIKALTEVVADDRKRKLTDLSFRHRVVAERYIKAFWDGLDDSLRASEMNLQVMPSRQEFLNRH